MLIKQKKELAQLLYVRGVVENQSELAERVGVSAQTISKWKKVGNWDDFKKSLLTTRQEELRNLYDQLAEINNSIKEKPKGNRFANNKEADVLSKLTATIRNLETEVSIAQTVDVFMKFNDWLRQINLEKAKEVVELQDLFVKTLL